MTGARRLILTPCPRQALPDPAGFDAVLVPNSRAARALGLSDGTPSLEIMAWRLAQSLVPASELDVRRCLRRAVREVLGSRDVEGTSRTHGPTVRELLRAGPEASAAADGLSVRAQRVLALAERYRSLLRLDGLADPAEILRLACVGGEERKRILVTGYPRFSRGELEFLDSLAGPGSVVVLPWDEAAPFAGSDQAGALLGSRGWEVERQRPAPARPGEALAARLAGRPTAPGGLRALRFPTQEAEVRFVLTEVKALLHRGVPREEIVLIARDDAQYGPLLRAVANEYEVPVKLSYAVPLRETRPGSWLAALAQCLREGFPFEATARLLAHPLCRALDGEAWTKARKTHPHGTAAWLEVAGSLEALAWPARAQRQAHVDRLQRALDVLGVWRSAEADPQEPHAFEKLRALVDELADAPAEGPGDTGEVGLLDFVAELDDLLSLLSVTSDPPEAEGVELHTPLAVYGAGYRHLFVLGLAEGVLPAPVRDDPVLDFLERARLRRAGLPLESAAEAAEREQISFWAALETAEGEVTLTHPELIDDRERVPSPFFALLGATPESCGPKPPASRMEARAHWLRDGEDDGVIPSARQAWTVELRRESGEPWDVYDGVVGEAFDADSWRFSASQLNSLGQCAFRWFLQNRLCLEELEEAEEEVSPRTRGSIYHRALEIALEKAMAASDTREAALACLEEAFAQAEEEVGRPAQASWPLRRPQHIETLRRVLRADDFFLEGGEILSLEGSFKGEWRGLRVSGKVDRVDRGADGLVLVDYKTRSTKPSGAKDSSGKARLDVQLPLYVETAAAALHPGESVAGARYYSLTKAKVIAESVIDDSELDALVARVRSHLLEGSYPVEPDVDGEACNYCDFDLVCRKGPRIERKRRGRGEA